MTITFKNDNDVIVYALEKIIAYARRNQHIFLTQSVWWISSIIGLQQGLITHIDNLRIQSNDSTIESRSDIQDNSNLSIPPEIEAPDIARFSGSVHPSPLGQIQTSSGDSILSESNSDSTTETNGIHALEKLGDQPP
jgi:hypothetical protein